MATLSHQSLPPFSSRLSQTGRFIADTVATVAGERPRMLRHLSHAHLFFLPGKVRAHLNH